MPTSARDPERTRYITVSPPSRPAASNTPPGCCILWFESVLIIAKKEKPFLMEWLFFFGDPERTRTVDLQRDRLAC